MRVGALDAADGLGGGHSERTEREHGGVVTRLEPSALAHGHSLEGAAPVDYRTAAAGVAYDPGAAVGQLGGEHEAAQLTLVVGGGDGEPGYGSQGGQVESAVVGGAVFAHEAGAVEAEGDGQVEQRHVVDDVVVGSLGEGGVDVAEGQQPLLGHACGEGDGVALGYAHVEGAGGKGLHEDVHGAACGHGGGDAHYAVVLLGQLEERVAEDVLELRRLRGGRLLDEAASGGYVEAPRGVPEGGFALGRLVALALDGVYVEELGASHVFDFAQHAYKLNDVVAAGRPEVAYVESLEDVLLVGQQRLAGVVEAEYLVAAVLAEYAPVGEAPAEAEAQAVVPRAGVQVEQIFLHAAHGLVYAHVVVVEYDEQVVGGGADVVEPFEGQSATHGSVAYDRHDLALLLAASDGGDGHAEGCGDGVGGVAAGEGVVGALLGSGEGGEAVPLAVGAEGLAASCEYLVAVGLVAHVPDDAVLRGVEHIMERHRHFDRPKAGGEVTRIVRQLIDDVPAQFVAYLRQGLQGQTAQVGGAVNVAEILEGWLLCHTCLIYQRPPSVAVGWKVARTERPRPGRQSLKAQWQRPYRASGPAALWTL